MLLFYNGMVRTVDPNIPQADALLVGADGRISAVGNFEEVSAAAPAGLTWKAARCCPGSTTRIFTSGSWDCC
jgi:hypothetical protein